jgi:hypothetical protein
MPPLVMWLPGGNSGDRIIAFPIHWSSNRSMVIITIWNLLKRFVAYRWVIFFMARRKMQFFLKIYVIVDVIGLMN